MYELLIFVFWVLLSEPPFRIIFVIDIMNILTFSTQAALRAHCTLSLRARARGWVCVCVYMTMILLLCALHMTSLNPTRKKKGVLNCIGGSFHIDFVFQYAYMNADIAASHHDSAFPAAAAQLNTSLAFQTHGGAWSRNGLECACIAIPTSPPVPHPRYPPPPARADINIQSPYSNPPLCGSDLYTVSGLIACNII